MTKIATILSAVLLLAGCANLSNDKALAVTCQSYASALRIVTPFKPRMNPTQIQAVDSAVGAVGPACRQAALGRDTQVTDAILGALDGLLKVKEPCSHEPADD